MSQMVGTDDMISSMIEQFGLKYRGCLRITDLVRLCSSASVG